MPSRDSNILAKDVIADARSLVYMEDTRLQNPAVGRNFYNSAVLEMYTLLGYIDKESITASANTTMTSKVCDLSEASFDDYDNIEAIYIPETDVEFRGLSVPDFARLEIKRTIGYPYQDCIVYTVVGSTIKFLFGSSVKKLSDPALVVYFTKQPTALLTVNYETAKLDLPRKYYPLIVNRIASYYELSVGMEERFTLLYKTGIEVLTASLDSVVQNKIVQSLRLRTNYNKDNEGAGT